MENRNLAVTNQKYCLICDRYDLKNTITEQLLRDTLFFFCLLFFHFQLMTFVSFHTISFYRN